MTSINTASMGSYLYVTTPSVKTDHTKTTADAADATVRTALKAGAETSAAGSSESASPADQVIKRLQEQIKETLKRLLELQQQLAVAQNSKTPEPEKSQQVMALQQQVAGTMSQLTALQAALLELMKGKISVTA
jgi:hypothetical protein